MVIKGKIRVYFANGNIPRDFEKIDEIRTEGGAYFFLSKNVFVYSIPVEQVEDIVTI